MRNVGLKPHPFLKRFCSLINGSHEGDSFYENALVVFFWREKAHPAGRMHHHEPVHRYAPDAPY